MLDKNSLFISGKIKYIIKISHLISIFFFNVTIRKFTVTYMVHIIWQLFVCISVSLIDCELLHGPIMFVSEVLAQ